VPSNGERRRASTPVSQQHCSSELLELYLGTHRTSSVPGNLVQCGTWNQGAPGLRLGKLDIKLRQTEEFKCMHRYETYPEWSVNFQMPADTTFSRDFFGTEATTAMKCGVPICDPLSRDRRWLASLDRIAAYHYESLVVVYLTFRDTATCTWSFVYFHERGY